MLIEEIDFAFDYYLKISENIALRFSEELSDVFDILEINRFFEIRYKDVRAIPLTIFPFLVFFTIEEKTFISIPPSTPTKVLKNILKKN